MKWKTKLLIIALVVLAPLLTIRVWYSLTDNFYITGIQNDFPFHPEWEMAPPSPEELADIKASLQSPLTYLNKGAQVFAFQTADGKYVLKFFKFKHSKPSYFIEILPPIGPLKEFKESKRIKKLDKIALLFKGHVDAYNYDKADTGLVYLHLNKTKGLDTTVTIKDKLGREFLISLDDTVYVVQKKGVVLRDALKQSLDRGDTQNTISQLNAIIDLYFREYQKGIYDCDHGFDHNTGFTYEGNAFRFDVGKSCYSEEFKSKDFMARDMDKVLDMMSLWLKDRYKQYESEIMPKVREHVERYFTAENTEKK